MKYRNPVQLVFLEKHDGDYLYESSTEPGFRP